MPETAQPAANQQTINDLVNAIPKYNGNPKALTRFVTQTDEIIELINGLQPNEIQIKLILFQIKAKLTDRAEELINDHKFDTWKDLREFLIAKYEDKQQAPTIACNMVKLQQGKLTTFEYLQEIKKHKDRATAKINLCNLTTEAKDGIIVFIESIAVHSFISNCKDPYRNNLATRNPATLEAIETLLTNDFQYLHENQHQHQNFNKPKIMFKPTPYNFNLPAQQKPYTTYQNHQSPMYKFPTPQRAQQIYKPKPFAPRANVRNAQFVNPTPMSAQTRQTQSQNYFQQNRPQNSFHQNQPQQNFAFEELFNQNLENTEFENPEIEEYSDVQQINESTENENEYIEQIDNQNFTQLDSPESNR